MSKDPSSLTSIRVKVWTVEKLNTLAIEIWWVELDSQDKKINHLIWFYQHYKNNNGSNKIEK